jgi:hypothetical protein
LHLIVLSTQGRSSKKIINANPEKIFVALDGPRKGNFSDHTECLRVRTIVDEYSETVPIQKLYRDQNLGCGKAVSNAISWFFNHVDKGIILEDDCHPNRSFFEFCGEMLEKYARVEKVYHVSGLNLQQGNKRGPYSYYFSRYPSIWGWATWKDRWQSYDYYVESFPSKKTHIKEYLNTNQYEWYYHEQNFKNAFKGNVDTWDYQWVYHIFNNEGLCIIPNENLISNIGVGENATHTQNTTDQHFLPTTDLTFPLKHPSEVSRDIEADEWLSNKKFTPKGRYFKTRNSLKQRIKDALKWND